ncbi:MAG: tRNA (adenosine(37)-N6)-threonylcarbamoyltransferase complex dimerization subunit type 1 TsaB [Chlamydiales bacterium]|nr:tRNA (adenosine(37)-N6)-threonylcarbamoyltransferase complex dimerization subunit type 1 TsaB [Chlamydiales bacterium]
MFLIIETATARGLVALCSNDGVIGQTELLLGLSNSRALEPALQKLLQEARVLPRSLQFVAVGQGPGSYTGLRVGAASAKAIAIGCNIPLVGLNSLRGFVPPDDFVGSFVAAIDAKIGGVYMLRGQKTPTSVVFEGEESLAPIEEFEEALQSVDAIATPGWELLQKRLKNAFDKKVFEVGPSAQQLFIESKSKFQNKEYSSDGSLPLLYLRLTQAEMEKLPNKDQV